MEAQRARDKLGILAEDSDSDLFQLMVTIFAYHLLLREQESIHDVLNDITTDLSTRAMMLYEDALLGRL